MNAVKQLVPVVAVSLVPALVYSAVNSLDLGKLEGLK